jgi:hypothetical protein
VQALTARKTEKPGVVEEQADGVVQGLGLRGDLTQDGL